MSLLYILTSLISNSLGIYTCIEKENYAWQRKKDELLLFEVIDSAHAHKFDFYLCRNLATDLN